MMDSGAILIYLSDKTGKLMPAAKRVLRRAPVPQVPDDGEFHVGGAPLSPRGQISGTVATSVTRKDAPALRVLNDRLKDREYLAGEYSIADIATYPWVARYEWHKTRLQDFPEVNRWYAAISERPAVKKGMAVPG